MKPIPNRFVQKIKNFSTPRTLSLLTFLAIFISLPLIVGSARKPQDIRERAQGAPNQIPVTTIPNGSTAYPIYGTAFSGDNLNPAWHASTWYNDVNEVNLQNKTPIYMGSNSISWTDKAPQDTLDLISASPIDITQYNYLSFYGQSTQVGQLYGAVLLNTSGAPIGTVVPFAQYGGVPNPSYWTVYNFPLTAFNAGTTTIGGVAFRELAGGAQPPVFIDEILLSRARGEQTTPTPQFNATNVPTALPTPEPFYYPNISPWVFIIPGVIIFLAVLFQ